MKMIKKTAFLLAAMAGSLAFGQISFAAKAHAVLPADKPSWRSLTSATGTAITENGKNVAGFNVGISARVDLPASFFVMPEMYYTHFGNSYTPEGLSEEISVKYNRIDIPVLLGYRVLGDQLGLFLGPVGSFNLTKDADDVAQFRQSGDAKNYTMGYQIGAEAKLKKLIISARYEGAFSNDQRKFINTVSGREHQYDNRPSHFLVGLGYRF